MNILFHCRVKVKKILLKAFAKKKALDRLSHIRHTSTVFTVFTQTKKSVQGTHLVFVLDTIWCQSSRVESERKKRVCERKTLKGQRKES